MSASVFGVSFDAQDARVIANFWAEVLGRSMADGGDVDHATIDADPAVPGSRIGFVPRSPSCWSR